MNIYGSTDNDLCVGSQGKGSGISRFGQESTSWFKISGATALSQQNFARLLETTPEFEALENRESHNEDEPSLTPEISDDPQANRLLPVQFFSAVIHKTSVEAGQGKAFPEGHQGPDTHLALRM